VLPLVPGRRGTGRAVVIRNPASRHARGAGSLTPALQLARAAGWHVDLVESQFAGHGTELAREAARSGADAVIVHGGDGAINEAVNALAGGDCALGVLPAGTADVWAHETHIDRRPAEAMRQLLRGDRRRIDLGRANGRYFLLMAGIGLDGRVIERVGARSKRLLGSMSYLAAGVPAAVRTSPWDARLRIDERDLNGSLYWMVVGNTRSYGGFRDITRHAVIDDGLLDVAMMHHGGVFHLLVDGARLIAGRHERSPNVDYVQARRVAVETPGIPVQVDGERHGETPLLCEVAPRALTVIVPSGVRSPLFSTPVAQRAGDGAP
jgi:YegS/Rv2252/BmrU family lipid kinase